MIEFLECELAEIATVCAMFGERDFNTWFDKSGIKARIKKACMQEQRLRCCYCHKFRDTTNNNEWDLEHILCEQWYPQFFATPGNLAVVCKQCNGAKGEKDVLLPQPRPDPRIGELPTESARYSIPHPWIDNWDCYLSHVNYQIYCSETEKGLTLIELCQLNRTAVQEGGLSYETIVAAVRTQFFSLVDNAVDPLLPDDEVLARVARITDNLQALQVDARLKALEKTLATLARRAERRTPEQAVEQARRLASDLGEPASGATAPYIIDALALVQAQSKPAAEARIPALPPSPGTALVSLTGSGPKTDD